MYCYRVIESCITFPAYCFSTWCCFLWLFCLRADGSMYHALGYATIMYMQAVLTYEQVSLE